MSRKMMVLALTVVSAAFFALPAVASAQSWHIAQATSFSVTGSGGTLTPTSGANVTCTSTTGSGSFSTTTGGTVRVVFHGCTSFGLGCTTPGQTSGTIVFTDSFDGIMVNSTASTKDPGILLTPDNPSNSTELTPSGVSAGKKFTGEFSCLGISIKLYSNGLIGTTSCIFGSSTLVVSFASSSQGHQNDKTWTGTTYDMISNIDSSHPTTSLDGTVTLTFPSSETITCT
jgi:hypothetical protein